MNRQSTSQNPRRPPAPRNSSDFYRPGRRERDQDADQRHATNLDHDRDHDRSHDPPNQRRNSSSSEPKRPGQKLSEKQRHEQVQPGAGLQASSMDQDRVQAELVTLHRQLCNIVTERVRWISKKETEARGLQRREENYKKIGSSHFPAIAESLRMQQSQSRRQETVFDEEIAKTDALLDKLSDKFCQSLVKAQSIEEIKARQLVEIAKEEVAKAEKAAIELEAAGRFQKLEEQLASLQETQNAQKDILDELRLENERLRSREALHETQAGELAALKTRYEELQRHFDSQAAVQMPAFDALKREKESLAEQVSQLQDRLAALVERVDTQHAEATDSFQQYTHSQEAKAAEHAASWEEKMARMEHRADEHGKQISSFDTKAHQEALQKLLAYPAWTALDDRLRQLSTVYDKGVQNVDQNFRVLMKRVTDLIEDFVQKSSKEASDLKKRVQAVETQAAAASGAPSVVRTASPHPRSPATEPGAVTQRIEATETAITGLQSANTTLRNDLEALRNSSNQRLAANEQMIINLDWQWQNMTTFQMANIIMDHVKGVSGVAVPEEMQSLCNRLTNLETWQTGMMQKSERLKKWARDLEAGLEDPGRRDSTNQDPSGRGRKRRRVEEVNGAAAGQAAEQAASPA